MEKGLTPNELNIVSTFMDEKFPHGWDLVHWNARSTRAYVANFGNPAISLRYKKPTFVVMGEGNTRTCVVASQQAAEQVVLKHLASVRPVKVRSEKVVGCAKKL